MTASIFVHRHGRQLQASKDVLSLRETDYWANIEHASYLFLFKGNGVQM
jgi:hypothetical protein